MPIRDQSPTSKALQINLDDSIYGTFAEIGAGQEVARHFFQAGRASHTIAKSISAYDMIFSDEIYGKSADTRYVCEARLQRMLDHEFSLLEDRLQAKRGATTRFFAFADTVATASQDDRTSRSHGWMGIRFQARPGGPSNDIILHVKLWDRFRLQQQEALGILGVNLLHMAFFPSSRPEERITALLDSLNTKRIEVNMIRFSGPDLQQLDNRLLSLELVKQHLTEAVLFGANSEVQHVGDALFRQPVLVYRGSFRPITLGNVKIVQNALSQFQEGKQTAGAEPLVLHEITMNSLTDTSGTVDAEDFLQRVDTLNALGQKVMISNFQLFYQMKVFLRQYTDRAIGILIGGALLEKMFDEAYYKELPGGILEGMSRLFDKNTRIFVAPFRNAQGSVTTASFSPAPGLKHLYQHLCENQWITDVVHCDDLDTAVLSSDVREMLNANDPQWKDLVPPVVRKMIEEKGLFGYRPGK